MVRGFVGDRKVDLMSLLSIGWIAGDVESIVPFIYKLCFMTTIILTMA